MLEVLTSHKLKSEKKSVPINNLVFRETDQKILGKIYIKIKNSNYNLNKSIGASRNQNNQEMIFKQFHKRTFRNNDLLQYIKRTNP